MATSLDVSSRGKRRKAVAIILALLERVCDAEKMYMERMPLNLQATEAYAIADDCVDTITEAIACLSDLY